MARWPSLPSISDLTAHIKAVKEMLERMTGQRGDWRDEVVTKGDLVDGGLAQYRDKTGKKHQARNIAGEIVPIDPGMVYYDQPPAIAGLTALGSFGTIHLQWTAAAYPYVAQYYVYRAAVNDYAQAVLVGATPYTFYSDPVGKGTANTPFYYWVTVLSRSNKEGPKNVQGVEGRTAYDPAYVLSALTVKWQANHVYDANSYVIPNPAFETGFWYHTALGGTSGATEPAWTNGTVTDNAVTWTAIPVPATVPTFVIGEVGGQPTVVMNKAWISQATILQAMIENLSSNNIAGLTITAAIEMLAATVTGGLIRTSNGIDTRIEIASSGLLLWAGSGAKTQGNGLLSLTDTGQLQVRDTSGNLILDLSGVQWSKVTGAGKPSDNADNTATAIQSVVSINDAGAIRNASWQTTKKISIDFANQQIAIGSDGWGDNSPKILMQYNAGVPRFYVGNGERNYIKYDSVDGFILGPDVKTYASDSFGNNNIYAHEYFETKDTGTGSTNPVYSTALSNSATITYDTNYGGVSLNLSNSANSYLRISRALNIESYGYSMSHDRYLSFHIKYLSGDLFNNSYDLITGAYSGILTGTDNDSFFGFHLTRNTSTSISIKATAHKFEANLPSPSRTNYPIFISSTIANIDLLQTAYLEVKKISGILYFVVIVNSVTYTYTLNSSQYVPIASAYPNNILTLIGNGDATGSASSILVNDAKIAIL